VNQTLNTNERKGKAQVLTEILVSKAKLAAHRPEAWHDDMVCVASLVVPARSA
jgi:hypothetical protein